MTKRLVWSSAAYSHVGLVRKVNEDSFLEQPQLGDNAGLWAVADGMGGHEAGDVASQTIVEKLRCIGRPSSEEVLIDAIKQALAQANEVLQSTAAQRYQRQTIGSTVVVFAAYRQKGIGIWAGDSRIYRLREGKLQQLTRDHSHVQEMVDRGLISEQEAHHHPMSNVITRAVGSQQVLELDQVSFPLQAGDIYMLCSDGLSKMIAEDEIARCLGQANSHNSVHALIQAALEQGADDNVTTAVINVRAAEDVDHTANTIPLDSLVEKLRRKFSF